MSVVAIVGTYRKGRTIDTAVDEALRGAREAGSETAKIFLLDKHIEFCTNCRACTQTPGPMRGRCTISDDMDSILEILDDADAYIFASPVNFFTVTALFKRFIERMICYADWSWHSPIPKTRTPKNNKPALLMTSSACPTIIGHLLIRNPFRVLKAAGQCLGVRDFRKLYFGTVARTPEDTLKQAGKRRAYLAGQHLVNWRR